MKEDQASHVFFHLATSPEAVAGSRHAQDAEEDALLVVQHDKDGKDIEPRLKASRPSRPWCNRVKPSVGNACNNQPFVAGLWDQGVFRHFCDTRESPPLYGGLVFGKPFLLYHRSGHFPQRHTSRFNGFRVLPVSMFVASVFTLRRSAPGCLFRFP